MTLFLVLAAAMVLAALIPILRPLLAKPGASASRRLEVGTLQRDLDDLRRRRDEGGITAKEFEQARTKLALGMLDGLDPPPIETPAMNARGNLISALAIAVLVPATAVALYWKLGASELLTTQPLVAGATGEAPAPGSVPPVEELLGRVVARLQENPEDVRGWELLARSYLQTGRFAEAQEAYSKLYELVGERPDVMVGYAEAMARAGDGDLSGRPLELIESALRMDADNQQGLWLAGLAAVQGGDRERARSHWQRLLALQQPGSESEAALKTHLAELDAAGPDPASPTVAESAAPPGSAEQAGASVLASVSLDPGLRDQVEADDTLFIYARVPDGPRVPVALARHRASELPIAVRLDDSMAMLPQLKLSNFADVEVVARISKSGQAAQQSGDLIGTSGAIAVGSAEQVTITISQVIP